ncbi:hypothetical protein Sjap_005010 [Stephania japonica]|uniref:Uncharacterized protein n=1 Tax=Stephania japonica TaxID=461633 RepID=A0AAP0K3A3_9MAGN
MTWLKNAMGRSSCDNTTPTPTPETFVSITKSPSKFGRANVGTTFIVDFK